MQLRWLRSRYVQVLLAVAAAILLGSLAPAWAQAFKRAVTNLVGNAVATVVVAKWEGEVDMERVRRVLGSQ